MFFKLHTCQDLSTPTTTADFISYMRFLLMRCSAARESLKKDQEYLQKDIQKTRN